MAKRKPSLHKFLVSFQVTGISKEKGNTDSKKVKAYRRRVYFRKHEIDDAILDQIFVDYSNKTVPPFRSLQYLHLDINEEGELAYSINYDGDDLSEVYIEIMDTFIYGYKEHLKEKKSSR